MPLRSLQYSIRPERERRGTDEKTGEREPPQCPKCGTRMRWFSTDLRRDGKSRLVHTYYCPACSEVSETEEPWRGRMRLV